MSLFRRSQTNSTTRATPPPPAAAPTVAAAAKVREAGRTAPEPLTLLLPALAALGAIASIAAVAYTAEDRTADRPRVKRRVDQILRDLEISTAGLAELLRRIKRSGKSFGLEGPVGGAALKFGLAGQRLEAGAGPLYHQLANDLATMLVLATQNSFECISAVEDGEIEAPEQVFQGFAAAQEQLNGLIVQRAGARVIVDQGIEIAQALAGLVRQLKLHKVG